RQQGASAVERGGAAFHQVEHRAERRLGLAVALGGGGEIEQFVVLAVNRRDARSRRGLVGCELHGILPLPGPAPILRHGGIGAKSFVAIITIRPRDNRGPTRKRQRGG